MIFQGGCPDSLPPTLSGSAHIELFVCVCCFFFKKNTQKNAVVTLVHVNVCFDLLVLRALLDVVDIGDNTK